MKALCKKFEIARTEYFFNLLPEVSQIFYGTIELTLGKSNWDAEIYTNKLENYYVPIFKRF